jgi:hypothetical protein
VFDGSNLGLGVTPSASNACTNIELPYGATLSARSNTAAPQFAMMSNAVGNWYAATYKINGFATQYTQQGNDGTHAWYTAPSGTAGNAITFTQAMTLDASGNLMVGTTTPTANCKLTVTGAGISIAGGRGSTFALAYPDWSIYNTSSGNALAFDNGTERARIDSSGNLLVGTTTAGGRLAVTAGSAAQSPIATTSVTGDTAYQAILVTKFDNDSTTSQNFIQFQINNGSANCGKITANGANTAAFGSTSDQRVKENIAELPSQLANIMALRPVEFDYIESYGGGHQVGFIAQEIQQVYPDVISTDDSSEKIMSITGWSKTEARLVKAIQEQQAIIESLKARLDAANL